MINKIFYHLIHETKIKNFVFFIKKIFIIKKILTANANKTISSVINRYALKHKDAHKVNLLSMEVVYLITILKTQ